MQLGLGGDPHMCQMVTGREGICEEALEIRVVEECWTGSWRKAANDEVVKGISS